jgi:phosphotransferase system IIB component
MHDVTAAVPEQLGVVVPQMIHMHANEIRSQETVEGGMSDGGSQTAVVIGTLTAQPLVHGTAAVHEHLEFLAGFSEVGREAEPMMSSGLGGPTQQLRLGGVGGVRGKTGTAPGDVPALKRFDGGGDQFGRFTPRPNPGHFEE